MDRISSRKILYSSSLFVRYETLQLFTGHYTFFTPNFTKIRINIEPNSISGFLSDKKSLSHIILQLRRLCIRICIRICSQVSAKLFNYLKYGETDHGVFIKSEKNVYICNMM